MAWVSLRNGVPEMARRRGDGSKAERTAEPQARSSPAWWISSSPTTQRSACLRSAPGGRADGRAPGPLGAGVVDLGEDDDAALGVLAQRPGVGGDLLVGDHDAVHVTRQAAER